MYIISIKIKTRVDMWPSVPTPTGMYKGDENNMSKISCTHVLHEVFRSSYNNQDVEATKLHIKRRTKKPQHYTHILCTEYSRPVGLNLPDIATP